MTEEETPEQAETCAVTTCSAPRVTGTNFCDAHGPKDAPKAAAPASKGAGLGCLALMALVVVFGITMCSGGGDDGPSGGAQIVACERAVKAKLANPETADFQQTTMSQTDTRVSGDVVAKTGFGVEKRLSFDCTMAGEAVVAATVQEVG